MNIYERCETTVVFVGASKTFTQTSVCLGVNGYTYNSGMTGTYIVDGDFLGREVSTYYPTEYLGNLLQPPIGGTFRIVKLTDDQLTVQDGLSGEIIDHRRVGMGDGFETPGFSTAIPIVFGASNSLLANLVVVPILLLLSNLFF